MSSRVESLRTGVEFELIELNPSGEPKRNAYKHVSQIENFFRPTFDVVKEGTRSQVEMNATTPVPLSGVESSVRSFSGGLANAQRSGVILAPLASAPLLPLDVGEKGQRGYGRSFTATPAPRYEGLLQDLYGQDFFDSIGKCGMHVHVSLGGRLEPDTRVQLASKLSRFQHILGAMSAASVFSNRKFTGFASSRMNEWMKLKTVLFVDFDKAKTWDGYQSQIAQAFADRGVTQQVTKYKSTSTDKSHDMSNGLDHVMIRPTRHGTVEFRMFDAPQSQTEAELWTMWACALTATLDQTSDVLPPVDAQMQGLLMYNACHRGMNNSIDTLNPFREERAPINEIVSQMTDFVRPVLMEAGVWNRFASNMELLKKNGFGASRQWDDYLEIHQRLKAAGDTESDHETPDAFYKPKISYKEALALNLYSAAGAPFELTDDGLRQRREILETTVWPAIMSSLEKGNDQIDSHSPSF